jgi:hypothetical protein
MKILSPGILSPLHETTRAHPGLPAWGILRRFETASQSAVEGAVCTGYARAGTREDMYIYLLFSIVIVQVLSG